MLTGRVYDIETATQSIKNLELIKYESSFVKDKDRFNVTSDGNPFVFKCIELNMMYDSRQAAIPENVDWIPKTKYELPFIVKEDSPFYNMISN